MKKNLFSLGLMTAAVIALASCAKEAAAPVAEEPVVKGVPFELNAGVDTKTTTTDASTINWAEADSVNVFHVVTGGTEYGSNDKFTYSGTGTSFTGTLSDGALTESAYDWYVLYPYSSFIVEPDNTSHGYLGIGSKGAKVAQVQAGNDSKAHLAGQYFPLYGKATNVSAGNTPSITLKQALSVVKVHVTNSKPADLTVNAVAFKAPEDIVGTYYIDFTGDSPVFTSSGAGYVSQTANLTVTGGTPIAQNGSADFYIAVKPFTAAVNDELVVSVNGEEKTITITGSAAEFAAGKIKTVNYVYDSDPVIYFTDFSYAMQGSSYKSETPIEGVDEGGQTSWGITYGNWNSSSCAQFRVYSSDNKFGTLSANFDCSHISSFAFDAFAGGTNLKLQPYYSTDKGESWTAIGDEIAMTTSSTRYKVTMPGDFDRARIRLAAAGTKPSSNNTTLTIDNLSISGSGAVLLDPVIVASNITDVATVGVTNATCNYTVKNFVDDVTVAEFTGCVSAAAVSSAGTVTYSVSANYSTSAANGTIVLQSASMPEVTKTINVAQLKSNFSVSSLEVTIPADATSVTFTVTSKEYGYTAVVASTEAGMNLSISSGASGSASADAQTVTVSSTTAAAASAQTLGTITVSRTDTDPAKKTITIKKSSAPVSGVSWVETALGSLSSTDEFVIVSGTYALSNNNGTGNPPSAVSVTVAAGKITSSVDDTIVWNLSGNGTDGYTFYPKDDNEKWLYCNTTASSGSNNNIRVGTGARKVFVLTAKSEKMYLVTKDDNVDRYVCLYNNTDWRGYIAANVTDTDTKFYKKVTE